MSYRARKCSRSSKECKLLSYDTGEVHLVSFSKKGCFQANVEASILAD